MRTILQVWQVYVQAEGVREKFGFGDPTEHKRINNTCSNIAKLNFNRKLAQCPPPLCFAAHESNATETRAPRSKRRPANKLSNRTDVQSNL